jgi:hypothetical protein
LTCVFVMLFLNAYSKGQLVVLEWKFKGIELGYDHLNRSKVIVDGVILPVSDSCRQSNWGTYFLKLSKTRHKIKFVNEAYYQGKWIEHTFENEFSINAICEFEINAKEVSKVQIEFDLNGSEVSVLQFDLKGNELIKKNTEFKGKHFPMNISWRFINVEKGYDHPSRMLVFVDDVEVGTSPQTVESSGGTFGVKIPKGQHRIRIVNQSFVKGAWQNHTIVNNYSVEAVYEKFVAVKKALKVTLVIDLNNERTVNEWEH